MSWIDPATMSLATALVVGVCAVIFIADTVVHEAGLAARIWALGFMAGGLTVISYLAWAFLADGWVATAVGNAAIVATIGCMWAGAWVFNGRALLPAAVVVAGASVATLVAVLLPGPSGGDWAGAEVMFVALVVLGGLGAVESRRRPLGGSLTSWGLTVALGAVCGYYVVRTWVFLSRGPESQLFREWFDTGPTGLLTLSLTVTVMASITLLRAGEQTGTPEARILLARGSDGYLDASSFTHVVQRQLERTRHCREHLAMFALCLGDLDQIRSAFGARAADQLHTRLRAAAQTAAPLSALLGTMGGLVFLAAPAAGAPRASEMATGLVEEVRDELTAAQDPITPILGAGVALSDTHQSAEELIGAARDAAADSAAKLGAGIVLSGVEGQRAGPFNAG